MPWAIFLQIVAKEGLSLAVSLVQRAKDGGELKPEDVDFFVDHLKKTKGEDFFLVKGGPAVA